MKKITEEIREAIKKAVNENGTQALLCKKCGISTSIMSRYIKNEVSTINSGTWKLLYPHIAPFLPEAMREKSCMNFPEKVETVSKMLAILEAYDKTETRQILDAVSRLSGIGD
ncbi:hypothetical protein SDC9_194954 [bioreactor metagenome]|uniref:Uncharacterized protein n=1 Tax=bioreactor metagenome TaxID=1076179 RepID=A0A645I969_9ZZZZ